MDKKEYYSPFEWTTDILFTTAIFKLCNFFATQRVKSFMLMTRGSIGLAWLLMHYFIWILNIRNEVAIRVSRPNHKESE